MSVIQNFYNFPFCYHVVAAEQRFELPVIWDAMMFMWCSHNRQGFGSDLVKKDLYKDKISAVLSHCQPSTTPVTIGHPAWWPLCFTELIDRRLMPLLPPPATMGQPASPEWCPGEVSQPAPLSHGLDTSTHHWYGGQGSTWHNPGNLNMVTYKAFIKLRVTRYSAMPLFHNLFYPEISQHTPHSSPIRVMCGVSFVSSNSCVCSTFVTQFHDIIVYLIMCLEFIFIHKVPDLKDTSKT